MNKYENFPLHIVVFSILHSLLLYCFGALIMFQLETTTAILYLIYILMLEIRIVRSHCINCYYYGKTCGFGKGRLSALLFKKGDNSKFCAVEMTWKDMITDMLVPFLPVLTGIVLMIIRFNYLLLISVCVIVLLSTFGNAYIRGTLTCKNCKQKDLGCPADRLFNKNKSS